MLKNTTQIYLNLMFKNFMFAQAFSQAVRVYSQHLDTMLPPRLELRPSRDRDVIYKLVLNRRHLLWIVSRFQPMVIPRKQDV